MFRNKCVSNYKEFQLNSTCQILGSVSLPTNVQYGKVKLSIEVLSQTEMFSE